MTAIDPPGRVGDLALRLAGQATLPAYIYDLAALDAHAAAIRAALPPAVQFCYAVKANPDEAILRTLARHADGFEVSSGGEVTHTAGAVPARPLAFGGPGKTSAELAAALRARVARFHVESPHELRLLDAAARSAGTVADALLRVNLPAQPPATAAPATAAPAGTAPAGGPALVMGGTPSPFGMDPALLEACALTLPDTPAVRVRGLHAHLASGLGADELLASSARLLDFGRAWCARHWVDRPEFNLGGGMAVDYERPATGFDWIGYGRGLAALARDGETLRVEPGRAVTAYCGWYVTTALDVKRSQGETFVIVSGGTHHLRTPAARGHSQPFAVIPAARTDRAPAPAAGPGPVTVTGQLCTPRDVLARRAWVPGVRAGDLIVFGLAGAYAWNISHHSFLMHPPPAFRYIEGEPR
jgi:diaminopimelate decarboxylase